MQYIKQKYMLALFAIFPLIANSASLEKYFKEARSERCPVETWNIIYNDCAASACGTENYGERQASRQENGHPSCGGFFTDGDCFPLIQPGEYLAQCTHDCTNKSKFDDLQYYTVTHTASLFRIRNKSCQAEACGEASRTPSTYSACRTVVNGLEDKEINNGSTSGSLLERELSLLAILMSEHAQLISKDAEVRVVNFVSAISIATESDLLTLRKLRSRIEKDSGLTLASAEEVINSGSPDEKQELVSTSVEGIRNLSSLRYIEPPSAPGQPRTLSIIEWKPSPYVAGSGVNTVTGEAKGVCAKDPETPDPKPKAKSVFFYLKRIDDFSSLLSTLGVNASMSVNAGLGNANGSVDYYKQISSSENAVYLVVESSVEWEDSVYSYTRLRTDWEEIAKSGISGMKRFYDGCGDVYVNGVQKINQFRAVYQLLARDSDEKERIKASFSGNYAGKFNATADFENAIQRIYRFTRVEVLVVSPGFTGDTVPTDPEGIIKYATSLPGRATVDNALPIRALTLGYPTFPNFPKSNPFIDGNQKAYLDQAEVDFRRLSGILNEIAFIKQNKSEYDFGSKKPSDLKSTELSLISLRLSLAKSAAACYQNENKCEEYNPIDFDDYWRPAPRAITYSVGGCIKKSQRFGNYEGGCLDQNWALTWSAPSDTVWNYEQAKTYCKNYSQNEVGGWILPTAMELLTLKGPDGGFSGLRNGDQLNDLYWVDSGGNSPGTRVNPFLGTHKENFGDSIPLRVICRQIGAH
jgi:hypothetical protein